jgi:tripartite-type tricarboxylate transporter receptor subunit TctC
MTSLQRTFISCFVALCFSFTAFAQTWPQRAIKVIAPYPPGGPSDIVIRTVSDKVQAALKQAVIIENIREPEATLAALLHQGPLPMGTHGSSQQTLS